MSEDNGRATAPVTPALGERRFSRSKSQLGTFERCGKQYKYSYIDRLKMASYWAARGIACHEALEAHYKHKVEHGTDLPADEVLGVFRASVHKAFSPISDRPLVLFEGQSEAAMLREGESFLGAYMAKLAPTIEPLMVEEPVEMTLPSGLRIKGRLDLVDTDFRIRDAKFLTDALDEDEVHYAADMPLYCAFFRAKTGRWPRGFVFDVVAIGRAKKEPKPPKAESVEFPDFERIVAPLVEARLQDLELADAGILAGAFNRRPSAQNCNKCTYTNMCWNGLRPGIKTYGAEEMKQALQASLDAVQKVSLT